MPAFSSSYYVLWAIVLLQVVIVLALLQKLANLQELASHGGIFVKGKLPLGSIAPELTGLISDSEATVASLAGTSGIIIFLSPNCSVCRDLFTSLRQAKDRISLPKILAVCRGEPGECVHLVRSELQLSLVTAGAEEAFALYGVSGSPTAVVVDSSLTITKYSHPRNAAELEELFALTSANRVSVPLTV